MSATHEPGVEMRAKKRMGSHREPAEWLEAIGVNKGTEVSGGIRPWEGMNEAKTAARRMRMRSSVQLRRSSKKGKILERSEEWTRC